ncbi:uncharacterized protein [Montipora foliosa]|uniref:uncharacterized protein n=1 Tax=Montipora foliosa TaxID=591990 RepID=UPI0035F1BCD7
MGWQKRGKGHNSHTGHAAVMSLTTGKVLDYTTRTKTCRFCDQGKNSNKKVKVHDCRKNHNASSKAMEPASAVEMFNNAPKQKVKYAFYTGDDDSTTEAHIRQKVSYGVEKFSDIIHMKRSLTTRLYNLSHNTKFANSSILSQKVINYLVKCFSYGVAQNKGNAKAIQKAINCIVPHAFGDHKNCDNKWCRFMQDPASYKHHDLPYGKDLFGDKLRSALENIFSDYCTDAVADKLAPMTNSQRNEALNSVVGSKNPKIRFYGGSESNDFRVACGVAQTNLRYGYVSQTLEALNIEPGKYCTEYNDRMTTKVLQDKIRKSTVDFKRRRSQLNSQKCSQTARKEAREGKTYETGIGLNLELTSIVSSPITDCQARVMAMPHNQFKEIEDFAPKITLRPVAKEVKYENSIFYNFLIFDTETNATGKSAEICQLSVTDKSASHKFSAYIMPTKDIDLHASKVNKLKIVTINGERKMYKDDKVVRAIPFDSAIAQFKSYLSQSITIAKNSTNKQVRTVLIGHNAFTFDTPILLRNAGNEFSSELQSMDVWFADSLSLFKNLIKSQLPALRNADGTFPKTNQSSLYKTLFNQTFDAHDALEDVLALRKILFSSKLELSNKTIVENSALTDTNHAFKDLEYLDGRHKILQSFRGKLYNPERNDGAITKSIAEKIAGSGLAYEDLKNMYNRYGKEGVIAILSRPPSCATSTSPRVTRTARILAAIVAHFQCASQP